MVCEGPILLERDKARPVCQLQAEQRDVTPVVHHMGTVDISPILAKFASAHPQLWDPAYQATQNVHMIRPAHDNWGIGKIVLTFCDDYMANRYEFPWWKEWRSAIEPIYQKFGIPSERVVRCLFASMPPGAFIKVHHDTGLWVKHTHRVHVPITSNAKVKFWIGSTNESLEVYPFTPGNVIELNNQSKHQVINEGDQNRIHMIFDYVDSDAKIPPSVILTPAQRLHQTRRSMDLEGASGRFPFPAFVLAGVTRSHEGQRQCAFETPEHRLLRFFMQHPLTHPSHHFTSFQKPGNFLDENWNSGKVNDGDLSKEETKTKNCGGADLIGLRKQYLKHFDVPFLKPRASIVTGELGATYLRGGSRTARRLKAIAPATKVVVVLVNPVLRAEMHYRDLQADSKESFEDLIKADLALLEKVGIRKSGDATPKLYQDYLKIASPRKAVVGGGLYAAQLSGWSPYFPEMLLLEADNSPQGLQRNVDRLSSFLGLPDSQELESEPEVAEGFTSSLSSELLTSFFQDCSMDKLVALR